MKKSYNKVLFCLGILIVVLIFLFFGFVLKFKLEKNKMTPIETKEIVENIYSVRDSFVNLYLIKNGDRYIAIDGGNNLDVVSKELEKLKINPEKIIAIFLTHTDMDHVAAVKLFKNAKLYLAAQEEPLINGGKSRFLFTGNKIDTKEYSLIADLQVLTIENIVIKGILTPGHTPGSMCFLINDKYLFSGDLLSIKDGEVEKFNDFFNMDTQTAINSIEKITSFPKCEYIFSSHYGYTNNYKNAVIDWIK